MTTNNIEDVLTNYGLDVIDEQANLTQQEIDQIDDEILEELSGH
jgi:hypothetical protein